MSRTPTPLPLSATSVAAALRAARPRGFTTRFAPAPTGYLHLGHVVNAIWVWGLARACGGSVLLRIEDHDRGRCRPEFERALHEDLRWLGLEADGVTPRQGERGGRYTALLESLDERELAYPCTCARAGIYPGTCRDRRIPRGETLARRLRIDRTARDGDAADSSAAERFDDLRLGARAQDPAQQCGDFLLRDRHGNYTYQFAVVVDDLDQGIDVVIRGEDLLDSTGRQLRLARAVGRAEPPRFAHHPLVRHADGTKLSKSAGDSGVRELRAAGLTAPEVLARAARVGGVATGPKAPHAIDAADLASLFA